MLHFSKTTHELVKVLQDLAGSNVQVMRSESQILQDSQLGDVLPTIIHGHWNCIESGYAHIWKQLFLTALIWCMEP